VVVLVAAVMAAVIAAAIAARIATTAGFATTALFATAALFAAAAVAAASFAARIAATVHPAKQMAVVMAAIVAARIAARSGTARLFTTARRLTTAAAVMERLRIGGVQHQKGAGQHSRRQHNTTFHWKDSWTNKGGSARKISPTGSATTFDCPRISRSLGSVRWAHAGLRWHDLCRDIDSLARTN
jgi:hypothetical protein